MNMTRQRSISHRPLIVILVLVGSVAGFLFGTDTGWNLIVIPGHEVHDAVFVVVGLMLLLAASIAARRWYDLDKEADVRKQVERELRRSRSQLAAAQQVAHVGSWEWDPATNAVEWSDELFRIFGLQPQQFEPVLDDYVERIHEEDRERVMQLVTQALGNKDSFNYSHRVVWPDGTVREIEAHGEVVIDEAGTVTKMVGTAQDITERRRNEELLRHANLVLNQSVQQLEHRNQEIARLYDLSEVLQSCTADDEAYGVIEHHVPRLFPSSSGDLLVVTASRNSIKCVASWGDSTSGREYTPSDCRALRTGKPHLVGDADSGDLCQHVVDSSPGQALCVPMIDRGEIRGVLHIRHLEYCALQNDDGSWSLDVPLKLGVTLAANLALALSNLELRETLKQQAIRDSLTGLFNRRYMEESLERELGRAERRGTSLVVIMIDLDHFKQLNDVNGHAAGDAVLRELGAFFQANIRTEDIACRYGGEEFVLILPDTTLEDAGRRADEIRQAFRKIDVRYNGQTLDINSMSLGVAAFPHHGKSVDDVLQSADAALYNAKALGRDRVVIFDPGQTGVVDNTALR